MWRSRLVWFPVALVLLVGLVPGAQAQFAVIDTASLSQLVSEVRVLEQQLAMARGQLTQAETEYQSITGARGMGKLLPGTVRNYLPRDWTTLEDTLQGSAGYPQLAADLQNAAKTLSVLSAGQLAALSPVGTGQLLANRQTAALLQSLSHQSLANASGRFVPLQQMIDTIDRATDQKSILELQARIAGEQNMLQNEHTKLETLYQGVEGQYLANAQRMRELTIAGHGLFQSRFQPQP